MGTYIESKDLREKNRAKLEEVVPLATPFVVYVDPCNLCNFRCGFCPTADKSLLRSVGRPRSTMSIELFSSIVEQLKAFPQRLRLLSLYKDGEPLLNKDFAQMVRIARDANVADRIWTKTNGSLLGPEVNEQLVTSGLDMIHISIEQVSVEGYERVAKVRLDYEKLKTNIADLYARRGDMKLTIKMADSGVSEDESKRFFDEFGPISDFIGIEKLFQWSYGGLKDFQMGTTPDTYDGLPLVNKIACAFPLYVLAVNADGSVSVCCNDWAYKTSVGRVGDRTLMEIWNSDELHEFRKMHLEGRRAANRACADCYYLRTAPDNIDAHRMTILERLENSRGTLRD